MRGGVLFGSLLGLPALFFGFSLLGKFFPIFREAGRFVLVGILNSTVDAAVLNALILATGIVSGAGYTAMKSLSFLAGATNSFVWNRRWTFEIGGAFAFGEAGKFYATTVLGGFLNIGAATFVVNGLVRPEAFSPHAWANIGALAGIATGALWNFFGYKLVVFRKDSSDTRTR